MELNELQIGDPGPGMKRQRHAVARRHRRIRRLSKHLTRAACGQQRRMRRHFMLCVCLIEVSDSQNNTPLDDELDDERMIDRRHGRERADPLPEDASDLTTGSVSGVENSTHGVGGFAAQGELAVRTTIELRPPFKELADVGDALFHQHRNGRFIAQPVTGAHGVGGVKGRAVVVADRRSNSALRIARIAFGGLRFCEDRDTARACETDCSSQAGNPAADNEEVRAVGGQSDSNVILAFAVDAGRQRPSPETGNAQRRQGFRLEVLTFPVRHDGSGSH